MVVFGGLYLLSALNLWPEGLKDYRLPWHVPVTVAVFGVLVLALPSIGGRIQWLWGQGFVQIQQIARLP